MVQGVWGGLVVLLLVLWLLCAEDSGKQVAQFSGQHTELTHVRHC